jgi:23S rRNA (cytosine1962-C5)-methyltransferase
MPIVWLMPRMIWQALTFGIDARKQMLAQMLMRLMEAKGVYERSDVDVRAKEGLNPATGVLLGEAPPDLIEIVEHGCRFMVDVKQGHNTGFYLDQRDNRAWLRNWLKINARSNQSLLNCFAYTGGFSIYALGADLSEVVSVDASADALALAKQNVELNGHNIDPQNFVEADVFQYLRELRSAKRQFDVIILDPPKFAQNQKQVEGALRGYKDINWLAFQLIKPGGLLLTFSCSGLVDADLFQKVVFGALVDAKREGQIISRFTAGSDHPVALTFPEGMYLKGLACRVW